MHAKFGRSPLDRSTLSLRRTRIDPEDLLEAAEDVLADYAAPGVTITIVDRAGPNPRILLTEAERCVDITVGELARDMEFARVPDTREGLCSAFVTWLNTRPVTDAAAAAHGIAVLTWADDGERRVQWQVVVPRPDAVSAWVPSFRTIPTRLRQIREDALARSRDLAIEPLQAGDVTVWIHKSNPVVSTAALANPERLLCHRPTEDLHVVFSPDRPVACADRAAAIRLTEETVEPHMLMPVAQTYNLGWN